MERTREQDNSVEGMVDYWQELVEEGRRKTERAQKSLEYSMMQLETWKYYHSRPSNRGQLLLPLGDFTWLAYKTCRLPRN